jgi:hypothetical protein
MNTSFPIFIYTAANSFECAFPPFPKITAVYILPLSVTLYVVRRIVNYLFREEEVSSVEVLVQVR